MRVSFYLIIHLIITGIHAYSQELTVISEGVVNGQFNEKIGMDDGESISIIPHDDCIEVSFSGKEVWAGVYLNNTDQNNNSSSTDLSPYSYLQFTIKAEKPTLLEKIGFGKAGETTELINELNIGTDWLTVVVELPKATLHNEALFSIISICQTTLFVQEVKYTSQRPTPSASSIQFISSPYSREEEAHYVFSESFETGAPSGYAGEKNGISLSIDDKCMEQPYKGKYCIKMTVDPSEKWRAIFLQFTGKWTDQISDNVDLPDLSEYNKLVFYGRSPNKHYYIPEIGFGGDSNRFSQEPRNVVYLEIDTEWERYEIDLRGLEKASVNDIMMFVLNEGTLYLDEIRFEK